MSKIEQAKKLFFDALAFIDSSDFQSAELRLRDALQFSPGSVSILTNMAVVLLQQNKRIEAREFAEKAIATSGNNIEALLVLGDCHAKEEKFIEALACYKKIISLDPKSPDAYNNCGIILAELGLPFEALDNFGQAIALDSNFSDAYTNRGNALCSLKRYDEGLAAYDKALALKPDLAEALLGRGNVFFQLERYDEACAAYDKALVLKPNLAAALLGRGNVFSNLKRYEEAFSSYEKALALKPDLADAWLGCANVFFELNRYDEARSAYDKALAIKPDLAEVESRRLHSKMKFCDWSNFDAECTHLISSVRNRQVIAQPFAFLAIPSSSDDQFQCAKLWIPSKYPPSDKPIWRGGRYNHDRIRLAYLSADFRQHAVSFLIAGMFECHDKSRFDVTAISFGPGDNSEMRQRLKASLERFVDAKTYSDKQIANLIKELEIDILVDLMGFTTHSRTGIFALRSAPIQVNYLGYPGTMGAQYIDYIIADRIVIPENQHQFYSEKIVLLPNSYQVNDAKRSIADRAFTRIELGLPQTGFVFCCFNNNYKITPCVFDCWMRILKQVENSVLWLLEDSATAANNLRKEAVARGVNSNRLIFAKRMPLSEHLARHRCADLFLDTLPYNAHTTASDALWVGLPVLTCLGEIFAGRVAASLLNAIRLPELITTTLEAYEQMALDLATHPEQLTLIKRKLDENRLTTPLFDTKLFTKHIEAAYAEMYERYQAGLAPDHIVISN